MKIIKLLILVLALSIANASYAEEKEVNGIPYIRLNNGEWMPRFGIGTFNVPGDSVCADAVLYALKCGYRHIDTAHAYRVERGVGKAVKDSGIPRNEIWITSKLWPSEYGEGKTMEAIDKMLDRLQVEYIDLLYVHQPMGDYRGAWRDMEKAVREGKVRSLGISNFDASDSLFNDIMEFAKIKPAVMQIECHPYAQRKQWQEKLKQHNIELECWFPLGGEMSKGALLQDSTIQAIAQAHGKTPAQVIIRWHLQEGFSVIPGATRHDYIKENISITDFQLSDDEMDKIRSLNMEKRFFNLNYQEAEQFMLNWKMDD